MANLRHPTPPPLAKEAALRPEVKLQAHQRDLLDRVGGRPGVIANHGMGLGKTLQALAIAEHMGGPCLVICPASVKPQFAEQMKQYVTDDRHGAYTFVSYDQVAREGIGLFDRVRPAVVICDEFHNQRNPVREREVLAEARSKYRFFMVGLTGTVFSLGPEDVVPLLNLVAGREVISRAEFRKRFLREVPVPLTPAQRLLGAKPATVVVPHNLKEFADLVRPWVHKVDSTPETAAKFPEVRMELVRVPMSKKQQALYDAMLRANKGLSAQIRANLPLNRQDSTNLAAFITGVRQVLNAPEALHLGLTIADNAKLLHAAKDLGEEAAKDPAHFKAIAYSNFLDAGVRRLTEAIGKAGVPAATYHGGLTDKQRLKALHDYNDGKIRMLGLSPAGGEGLNLKGTQVVQILDSHWNPVPEQQAIGRAARLNSHAHLPPEKRVVRVKKYLAVYPAEAGRFGRKPPATADEWVYARSQERKALNSAFSAAMPSWDEWKASRTVAAKQAQHVGGGVSPASIHTAVEQFCAKHGVNPREALLVGGSALYAHGIRTDINDVDLVHNGLPGFIQEEHGGLLIDGGPGGHLSPRMLDATMVRGLRVQTLPALLDFYKHAPRMNRPKDQRWIQALEQAISAAQLTKRR